MPVNTYRHLPEYTFQVTLAAGIAAREFTFKSPNFLTRFSRFDAAADVADGTDKPTWTVIVGSTTIATGTAIVAADTVSCITAVDAGQSDLIPANSTIKLSLSTAGTAGNVLGLTARLALVGTN